MKFYTFIFTIILALAAGGCSVGDVKEPAYSIVQKEDNFELRAYEPMIVAQVQMTGDRRQAINDGFKILADYIFGNNDGGGKIAMTAPVIQQPEAGAKIAMAAPVTQQGGSNSWKVDFIMPAEYTMETLPKPVDKHISILQKPSYKVAVARFSGFATEGALESNEKDLLRWMTDKALKAGTDIPVYAFYNPPWTLPFLRRNEVMIPVAD